MVGLLVTFTVATWGEAAFAQRAGFRVARALEDRTAVFFPTDFVFEREATLARDHLVGLEGERSLDLRLEGIRLAAWQQLRRSTAVLARYQTVESTRPGGDRLAWDVGKALLDTERVRNRRTGQWEDQVKADHGEEAVKSVLTELLALGEQGELRKLYWQRSVTDRALHEKLWELEATRSDLRRRTLNRVVYGVGMMFTQLEDGSLRVDEVLADGPAAAAGLRRGDLIVAVDGQAINGLSFADAAAAIRGGPRSVATLDVRRRDPAGAWSALRFQAQRLKPIELAAQTLFADVDDHFNGTYRGNNLSVRNDTGQPIESATVFFAVTYADRPDRPVTYMRAVDRWLPAERVGLETNPLDAGPQAGRIASMRVQVFSDTVTGWTDLAYDRPGRDGDIGRYLANLVFQGAILAPDTTLFGEKLAPGFSVSFSKSVARLSPKTVRITFERGDRVVTIPFTVKDWRQGTTLSFRNAAFTFPPQAVRLEVEFPDSDVKKTATWNFQ